MKRLKPIMPPATNVHAAADKGVLSRGKNAASRALELGKLPPIQLKKITVKHRQLQLSLVRKAHPSSSYAHVVFASSRKECHETRGTIRDRCINAVLLPLTQPSPSTSNFSGGSLIPNSFARIHAVGLPIPPRVHGSLTDRRST